MSIKCFRASTDFKEAQSRIPFSHTKVEPSIVPEIIFCSNSSSLNGPSLPSPSMEMKLPSVIALKEYVPQMRNPAFTRFNVFLRDRFSCQYCGNGHAAADLTFDHVVPRSRGGRTTWTNVVAACSPCNLRKANKLPDQCGMHPLTKPVAPNVWQLQENGRGFPPNYLHESWRDYLYWDSELQQT